MNRHIRTVIAVLALAIMLISACAMAEGVISTTVVMRVSRMTQSAVVNAGEDLSMEVSIDGVEPAAYQWYFQDSAIEGANQRVYNIVNADTADTGVYRLDAFDADGKMLVSMDISARVIDDTVPKSGDSSMPVALAGLLFAASAAVLFVMFRRGRRA